MTMIDGLPTLSAGGHPEGEGKACVMEYVSILAGLEWSDHPDCTDWLVADMARYINDQWADDPYGDALRAQALVPMIGRLLTTKNDGVVTEILIRKAAERGMALRSMSPEEMEERGIDVDEALIWERLDGEWCTVQGNGICTNILVSRVGAGRWRGMHDNDRAHLMLGFLNEVLDEYDSIVKPKVPEVSAEALADVAGWLMGEKVERPAAIV